MLTLALIILAALFVFWDKTHNNGYFTSFLESFFVLLLVLALVLGVIGVKTGI